MFAGERDGEKNLPIRTRCIYLNCSCWYFLSIITFFYVKVVRVQHFVCTFLFYNTKVQEPENDILLFFLLIVYVVHADTKERMYDAMTTTKFFIHMHDPLEKKHSCQCTLYFSSRFSLSRSH